jgi:hypothetical protein
VLHGVTAVSFWKDPGAWLSNSADDHNTARGLVDHVESALNSLAVADWVLLAIAAALVAWVWASLHASTRLGPIEIAALEHDGKDDEGVPVKALTAELREALSRTGLSPPPAVPAGTPQINLIDAIKESPIPEASWIAAIVQLVPRPRPSEYHIGGVLLGDAPPSDRPAPVPGPCGLRYAVVPAGDGTSELNTVHECPAHSAAVVKATSEIFLHISQDATGAFPIWARWHKTSSLEAFIDSWRLREKRQIEPAIALLRAAKREEPFNALADLQIANLYEQCDPEPDVAVPDPALEDGGRVRLRAHAVRGYLKVARAFPEVVEARYRLAVSAGMLASMLGPTTDADVVGIVGLEGVDTIAELQVALRALARHESDAVFELLRPWWALARLRLRTQFEPRGNQRRVMRRAVRISRHCHGLRRLSRRNRTGWWRQALIWFETRRRSVLVHGVHLGFGRGTAGWQAHYNAACFDALMREHFS